MQLYGREKIYTAVEEITEENVVHVVNKIIGTHLKNVSKENYLYWYRRGKQPILDRTKEVRPDIIRKIVINNANQVVTFKNGYFMTEPASYTPKNEEVTDLVERFNSYCNAAQKNIADNKVIDWFHTVGVGVLYIEPDRDGSEKRPIRTYCLDPRSAFVAYSYRPGNYPVMGVNIVVMNNDALIDVFTKDKCFHLSGNATVNNLLPNVPVIGTAESLLYTEANVIGEIPIIEYQYDINRMSAFEAAIPICDEINEMQSRLAEGVEQQIQQLAVAYNCNFDDGTTANQIRESGMLVLRSTGESKADFKLIETKLSQSDTQTNINSLYEQLLDKTGLPSIMRSDGGSSDNGSAVYLKSGYSIADTNRRNTEDFWRESDEQFKTVALKILKMRFKEFDLEPNDMTLNIEPPTMSNLLVKTQAALNMRQLGLHPQIWLERSGLSNDPLTDIELSKDYIYRFYETEMPKQKIDEAVEEVAEGGEGEPLNDNRQLEELSAFETE